MSGGEKGPIGKVLLILATASAVLAAGIMIGQDRKEDLVEGVEQQKDLLQTKLDEARREIETLETDKDDLEEQLRSAPVPIQSIPGPVEEEPRSEWSASVHLTLGGAIYMEEVGATLRLENIVRNDSGLIAEVSLEAQSGRESVELVMGESADVGRFMIRATELSAAQGRFLISDL